MGQEKPKKVRLPFGFSPQQVRRLQQILDKNGRRAAEFAEEWGISISAANKDVGRMRVKAEASSMAELLIKSQRVGAFTMTYDIGSGDAPLTVVRKDAGDHATSTENVLCRVLDGDLAFSYNVPILPLTTFSRRNLIDMRRESMNTTELVSQNEAIERSRENLPSLKDYCTVTDERFVTHGNLMRERGNLAARTLGLPTVGTMMLSEFGIA